MKVLKHSVCIFAEYNSGKDRCSLSAESDGLNLSLTFRDVDKLDKITLTDSEFYRLADALGYEPKDSVKYFDPDTGELVESRVIRRFDNGDVRTVKDGIRTRAEIVE